jgi:tetratricopeptide (TPR) repeat protein
VVCLEYAESLFHLKQFDEARAMLADCPPSVKSLGLTAECFREEGRRQEAHAVIDQLLQGEPPHDLMPLLFKGGLAIDDQDGETAVRVLSEAVSQNPKLEQARAMLATAYRLAGQPDEAAAEEAAAARLREQWSRLEELNAKVEAEPENVEALVNAGVAARELDRLDLAARYFSAALRIDPENAAAKAGLAGIPGASPAPADESNAAPVDKSTVPPVDKSTVPPADETSPAPADEGPAAESPPGGEPTVDNPPEDGGM